MDGSIDAGDDAGGVGERLVLAYRRERGEDDARASERKPFLYDLAACPPHPSLFVRCGPYRRFGGFDREMPIRNDVELMMRSFDVHRITLHYMPAVVVHTRTGGVSNRSLVNVLRQNREIMAALERDGLRASLARFIGNQLWDQYAQYIRRPKHTV